MKVNLSIKEHPFSLSRLSRMKLAAESSFFLSLLLHQKPFAFMILGKLIHSKGDARWITKKAS